MYVRPDDTSPVVTMIWDTSGYLPEELALQSQANCTRTLPSPCPRRLDFIMNVYIFTTLASAGIVTNFLNLLVFVSRRVQLKGTTFSLLKAMATADLFSCLICVPAGISRCVAHRHSWEILVRQVYEIYILLPLANSFGAASSWLTMVLAVERYVVVRYNLPGVECMGKVTTRVWILVIYVAAFAVNAPYLWYRVLNHDGLHATETEFGLSWGFEIYLWIRMALMKGVPVVFILIFNGLLVHAVHVASLRRRSMVFQHTTDSRRQRLQLRITAMMIAITVTFLVCHVLEPFSHASVYRAIHGPCSLRSGAYMTQRIVTNNLEILSYSSNFIFFCIFHRQFLVSLRQLLRCPGVEEHNDSTGKGAVTSIHMKNIHSFTSTRVHPQN